MTPDLNITDVSIALRNDEIAPHFQPLVEIHTGRVLGFEVLARWHKPDLGLVLPDDFIPLAEKCGLLHELTRQIVHKAMRLTPCLPAPTEVAINISPTQLYDPSLPRQIYEAATAVQFPLSRLTVEITETALAENMTRAQDTARELKAMGCKLALDDFGTGYSSLRHLQALPFDVLKVDKTFVQSMTAARESRKIVAAIIGLGHSLGLVTVAEGIETEEQADMLLCLGCEIGQGWLYGPAVPGDRVPDMLEVPPRILAHRALSAAALKSSLEAQPAQRLAQLQAIYDGAPVGLCFLDCHLRYVSINRRLADIEGSSIGDHLGRTVEEMVPHLYPAIEPYLQRALKGESFHDVEVSWTDRSVADRIKTDLISYQPAFDEAGEVIGISVAVVDITDRKRAELSQPAGSHAVVREMMKPEVSWAMDAEGNELDVSATWVQAQGLTGEQSRKLRWLDSLHPEDAQRTMKVLRDALESGTPIDVAYRVQSSSGDWRWMRSRGAPRLGTEGELLDWYGSVEDIEERKQLEESLCRDQSPEGMNP